jgi:tetratricopeptide (TPR) repeat protein
MKSSLACEAPRRDNHRVALYGTGGIGKTQCALEYVYANETYYDRIYWITAVDQASLLSGYQTIARKAQVPIAQGERSPVEIAHAVLSWLRTEPNWLIVIDNLDDIKVADRFLPENGPRKHTLITTRDPNAPGIPAEPLEVPLLDQEESVDLLSTLSNISLPPESNEMEAARRIVKELGYLPLAIEQAAAYIREVTGSIPAYSLAYQKNRQELHRWVPTGNRQYPFTVATTWSMSFHILQKTHQQATHLLRLLAFLNPDGVLLKFLESGVKSRTPVQGWQAYLECGLEAFSLVHVCLHLKVYLHLKKSLQHIISNPDSMNKALLVLEKFSLIKWNRSSRTISIHRLVQAVVIDEMSKAQRISMQAMFVDLCYQVFPAVFTNATRPICRMYQNQIVEPLLQVRATRTGICCNMKYRVAWFLVEDGKYRDGQRLLQQSLDGGVKLKIRAWASNVGYLDSFTIRTEIAYAYLMSGNLREAVELGEEMLKTARKAPGEGNDDTLVIMMTLSWTYYMMGRRREAADMFEDALKKCRRVLGEEHPRTLLAMAWLGSIYLSRGNLNEAVEIQEEALNKSRRIIGKADPLTLIIMHKLSLTYQTQRRLTEAVEMQEDVVDSGRRILGDEHPHTIAWGRDLVDMREDLDRMTKMVTSEGTRTCSS